MLDRKLGELEIVGGEEREGLVAVVQCAIALASARPSKVEVPRADLVHQHQRLLGRAVHDGGGPVISSMKVDCALARSSAAPMRVWMASIGP